MPSLNIKDHEIHHKAKELAQLTRQSVTSAVGAAIEEKLERERTRHDKQNRLQWLLQVSKETAALLIDGRTSKELMDELYDPETGLPI